MRRQLSFEMIGVLKKKIAIIRGGVPIYYLFLTGLNSSEFPLHFHKAWWWWLWWRWWWWW